MDAMFDIGQLNKLEPAVGRLLISEPFLEDPNFKRTVVLLCDHNEEGSFGFVLNRALDLRVGDFMDDVPDTDAIVSFGGPVQNDGLFYIHTLGERIPNSIPVMNGLFMGGDFESLRELLGTGEANRTNVRFFVGYSGWGSGQLEGEMEANSWIVAKSDVPTIMKADSEEAWGDILRSMGKRYSVLANFPDDPSLN
jgi:putative transcriptional regulator